jgi:hypothetical protein
MPGRVKPEKSPAACAADVLLCKKMIGISPAPMLDEALILL